MNLSQDNILDDPNSNNILQLTDRQLLGLLLDKEKFPEKIIIIVEVEIQRRKLSKDDINTLEAEFTTLANTTPLTLSKQHQIILALTILVQLITVTASFFVWQVLILVISMIAINKRLTKGVFYQKKVWQFFQLILFVIIVAIHLFVFFYW